MLDEQIQPDRTKITYDGYRGSEMTHMLLMLPKSLRMTLDLLKDRTGLSKSAIIRLAMLNAMSPKHPFSFYDYVRAEQMTNKLNKHGGWGKKIHLGTYLEEYIERDMMSCDLFNLSKSEAIEQWQQAEGRQDGYKKSSKKAGS